MKIKTEHLDTIVEFAKVKGIKEIDIDIESVRSALNEYECQLTFDFGNNMIMTVKE